MFYIYIIVAVVVLFRTGNPFLAILWPLSAIRFVLVAILAIIATLLVIRARS